MGFGKGGADIGREDKIGLVMAGRIEVVARRSSRHGDDGRDAELPGGVGDSLGVIAAADRHDAAKPFFRRQRQHLVERSAWFE